MTGNVLFPGFFQNRQSGLVSESKYGKTGYRIDAALNSESRSRLRILTQNRIKENLIKIRCSNSKTNHLKPGYVTVHSLREKPIGRIFLFIISK